MILVMEKVGRHLAAACHHANAILYRHVLHLLHKVWLLPGLRGDFPQWNFRRWWKQKACWLNQHKTTDCDCFAVAFARGQEALQWQSERHESVLVPRDIHLSQVWLPLLYYFSLLIHLIFRHCRTLPSDSTENYKASWTPQKSLIGAAESLLLWWWKWATMLCFVGPISISAVWQILSISFCCNKSESQEVSFTL